MKFATLSLIAALLAAASAAAQTVVVELFASQNCRACPKAHATLKEMAASDADLLVLTWSVDYWDYLGEADPMAMKESKERQLAYVEQFNLRGPYTPQTVYSGAKQCPGNKPRTVARRIREVRAMEMPRASIAEAGDTVVIEGGGDAAGTLTLVEYLPDDAHGTDMRNPVTTVRPLAAFDGGRLEIARPDCDANCAILLETPAALIPAALTLDKAPAAG